MARRSTKRLFDLRACAVVGRRYGIEPAIRGVARAQHGAVSRAQLAAFGLSVPAIDARVHRGELTVIHRGVYRVGPLGGERFEEAAAVLACGAGAYVRHRSALHLLGAGLDAIKPDPVELITTRTRVRRAEIRARFSTDLHPRETTTCEGIPVTTADRAILDCAATMDEGTLEHVLAQAFAANLTNRRRLLSLLARHRKRQGVSLLGTLLEAPEGPAVPVRGSSAGCLRSSARPVSPRCEPTSGSDRGRSTSSGPRRG
jgi:hypothetical protein